MARSGLEIAPRIDPSRIQQDFHISAPALAAETWKCRVNPTSARRPRGSAAFAQPHPRGVASSENLRNDAGRSGANGLGPADLLPDSAVLRLRNEEPPHHGGDQGYHNGVD